MGKEVASIKMPGGLTMAEASYKKLTNIGLTTYLSVNERQSGDGDFFNGVPIIKDHSQINARGPLLGLLSAHKKFPMDDIFLLACNMPLMKNALLNQLFDLWLDQISEVYVYQKGGRAVPYCGIYTYSALRHIDQLVEDDRKKASSLQYYVQRLNTCYVHIPQDDESAFRIVHSELQLDILG